MSGMLEPAESLRSRHRRLSTPLLRSRLGILLVMGACVAAYLPSIEGPFVFDDVRNIRENPNVRMTRLDPASLRLAVAPYGNLNLRPLSFLTFALNHLAGGHEPFGYHAFNVAVLLLSVPAAYLLALRLGQAWLAPPEARAAALGAAAVWALHPLLTGGVSYVVQRMTSLYTLFSLGALLFFLRGRLSGRRAPYALAALSLLLALASKETALFTPLIALLALWLLPREAGGAGARAGWALLGSVAASQAAMAVAAHYALRAHWIPPQPFGTMERLLTEGRVVARYLGLFLLPLPSRLTLDYDFSVSRSLLVPPSTLPALALHTALIALALLARRRRPLLSFGLLGFYLLQLPEGTFMPLDLICEHRAYFPAFFLSLALMDLLLLGARRLGPRRAGLTALVIAVVLGAIGGGLTFQRNRVWADPVRLWEDTVAKSPGNSRALCNLGVAQGEAGRPRQAVGYLQESLRLGPDNTEAMNNLGKALRQLGEPGRAVGYLQRSVQLQPTDTDALNALGACYIDLGDLGKAIAHLQEAVRLRADHAEALNNLGSAYAMLGQPGKAVGFFRRAIGSAPNFSTAYFNLGIALIEMGDVPGATAVWRDLRRIDLALAGKLEGRIPGAGD